MPGPRYAMNNAESFAHDEHVCPGRPRKRRPAAQPLDPIYFTADEVGALLRASPKTVYRLAKTDPSMPMLKLGGLVRDRKSTRLNSSH